MELLLGYLIAVTLMSIFQPSMHNLVQSHYKVIKDLQFMDTADEVIKPVKQRAGGLVACASACNAQTTCASVTYDTALKTCKANVKDVYTFGRPNITSSKNVYYMGKVRNDITEDDWILVFRAQGNNSMPMWNFFSNSSYNSDHDMTNINLAFSSKYTDVRLPHYRSRWLDIWPSKVIDLVRVQLYKDGKTEVTMIFNGTRSNQTNWFSFHRLVKITPYTDLTSEVSWFTLGRTRNRMFYVSNTSDYINCNQQAWILVEDRLSNTCYWSSRSNWPRILYSVTDHQVNFNDRSKGDNTVYRVADVLAVFIKFSRP